MDDSGESLHSAARRVPIVGIGASAAGLEAVSELLSALPDSPAMAFLLVQHLDPAHESVLAELLARHTSLPITQVKHDEAIVPDHIYVIAPNTRDGRRFSPPNARPVASHDVRVTYESFSPAGSQPLPPSNDAGQFSHGLD